MSDWNNKHFPSDFSQLTRRDLIKLAHMQLEENQKLAAELKKLKERLDE